MSGVAHERSQTTVVHTGQKAVLGLAFGALGIVYGDIGTSPLYAIKEAFGPHAGMPATRESVFGVLSLIVWSIITVVCVKYGAMLLKVDNRGEGGILALVALLSRKQREAGGDSAARNRRNLVLFGAFGAALLYGDGMITPVMSVFGAVEGLKEIQGLSVEQKTNVDSMVVPVSCAILIVLFLFQSRGTAGVAKWFSPITAVWFVMIALTGAFGIAKHPDIITAVNPYWGIKLLGSIGWHGVALLGAVVLAITGAEALYADMGHFGKTPIRVAWYGVVLPSLLINYFGQGALILEWLEQQGPRAPQYLQYPGHPFYDLVPDVAVPGAIVIATLAAVVASQALISGAFSLTQQATQLGFAPRVQIIHTSDSHAGQIYIPEVNWLLLLSCLGLAIGFKSSSNLASAYGISVTGTMLITTILFYAVMRDRWRWGRPLAMSVAGVFIVIDLIYLGANITKVMRGGWVPLVVAFAIFVMMTTWRKGRAVVSERTKAAGIDLAELIASLRESPPPRVEGDAVFLTANSKGVPITLLHHLRHNRVLHERVVLLNIVSEEIPYVKSHERATVEDVGDGFYRATLRFGFRETPNILHGLKLFREFGLYLDPNHSTFYLGRQILVVGTEKSGRSHMSRLRKMLFLFLSRNARSATAFFGLPPGRVIEIGAQVEL